MNQETVNTQEPASLATKQLGAAIESLLFVSGRPLERGELRKLLSINDARLTEVLRLLAEELEQQARGIRVQTLGEQVQLVTAPENARFVAALLGLPMTAKLTSRRMAGLWTRARAIASRWRCPPESALPFSATNVS
jgi:segregation and condensation protein B